VHAEHVSVTPRSQSTSSGTPPKNLRHPRADVSRVRYAVITSGVSRLAGRRRIACLQPSLSTRTSWSGESATALQSRTP
jgi:hypothetical protein